MIHPAPGVANVIYLQEGRLQRQLPAELASIAERIRESGLQDAMTLYIRDSWHRPFSEALGRREESADVLFPRYVRQLQENLCDALYGTPARLDADAVLGSDGRTYSPLALEIYQDSVGEPYSSRSPVDPGNPIPFTTRPHIVARYMVGWLQSHGELLFSPELQRAHAEVVQRRAEERQAIERLAAHQAALRQAEEERRMAQDREIERRMNGRLQAFVEDLQQRFAPPQPARVPAAHLPPAVVAVQERVRQMREQAFQRLQAQMNENVARTLRPADVEAEAAAGREAIAGLREQQANILAPIEAVAQRIEAVGAAALRDIQAQAQREREARQQLERNFQEIGAEIERLQAEANRLEETERDVRAEITDVSRAQTSLQQAINETRAAIDRKNREKDGIGRMLAVAAIVATCAFATWAANFTLAKVPVGVAVTPAAGSGVGVTVYVPTAAKAAAVTTAVSEQTGAAQLLQSLRTGNSLGPWKP